MVLARRMKVDLSILSFGYCIEKCAEQSEKTWVHHWQKKKKILWDNIEQFYSKDSAMKDITMAPKLNRYNWRPFALLRVRMTVQVQSRSMTKGIKMQGISSHKKQVTQQILPRKWILLSIQLILFISCRDATHNDSQIWACKLFEGNRKIA